MGLRGAFYGLFLMGGLLITALAAPVVDASFTAQKYPATVTGSLDPGASDALVTTAGTISCKTPSYKGTLTQASSTINLSPTFSECTAFGFPATIDANGCTFLLHAGDADLACPAGQEMTVTAISAGTIKCTVHFPAQSDIAGTVAYTDIGKGSTQEITANLSLSGIDYGHTTGTGLGKCTAGSSTTGIYGSKVTMKGENGVEEEAEHIALFVNHSLYGLAAEKYSATLTGNYEGGAIVNTAVPISCRKISFTASISSSASTVSVIPAYSECTSGAIFLITVDVNGCVYLAHVEGGIFEQGDVDLQCPAGKEIAITAITAGVTKCTIHIPPQDDLGGGISFGETGAGTTKSLSAQVGLSGINYTHTGAGGFFSCASGSSSSGSVTADIAVKGESESKEHVGIFFSKL